jgi:hypothetical protein
MANEFVARRGIIAQSGGAKITGSLLVSGAIDATGYVVSATIVSASTFSGSFVGNGSQLTNIAASSVDFANILNKPALVSSSGQIDHNATTNYVANEHVNHLSVFINPGNGLSGGGNIAANVAISLDTGSSHFTDGIKSKLNTESVVSSSTQFTSLTAPFTGSFTGSFKGDGSGLTGVSATSVDFANITNKPALVSASGQIDHDLTTNFVANEHIDHSTVNITAGSGLAGGGDITTTRTLSIDTSSAHFTGGVKTKLNTEGVISSSTQFTSLTAPFTGSFTGSFKGDGSQLTGIATTLGISGSTSGTDLVNLKTDSLTFSGASNVTATVTDNTVTIGVTGLVSESAQIDHNATANYTASRHVDHTAVNVTAGDGLSGGGDITATRTLTLNTGSAHFTGGVKSKLNTDGVISSSAQVDVRQTTGIATIATTGSNTFVGDQIISGSLITTADTLTFNGAMTVSGSLITTGSVRNTAGGFSGSFSGSFTGNGSGLTNVTATSVDFANITNKPALVSASGQIDHDLTTNFVANEHIDHSSVSITAGSGLTGGGDITSTRTLTLDTSSAHFTGGVKSKLNTDSVVSSSGQIKTVLNTENVHSASYLGSATTTNLPEGTNLYYLDTRVKTKLDTENVVSSSGQVDVRQTTGIATIATTGSNTFTGVQTISNTTNSTTFADGALIVAGGVGIGKDVHVSGSLTVTGLLTAASMSTQYVTSSQYVVGDNRIILNSDDIARFGGMSIVDSGSSAATASIFWDSLNHHFIYENLSGSSYNSAILIAGPKNYGSLGSEPELVAGRIPVATGGDHIDTNAASSSIYINFDTKQTFIEAGLYVTGAISSSVGFSGDGSNLSGIVTTLGITGSQGGTSTINLKTQNLSVDGQNGINATVSGQTLTLSASNATTAAKGVASFNSTNFTVTGGEVTSNNITINGTNVTLGGTRNITLAQITAQGASTTDAVTLSSGATIGNTFHTSSAYTAVGPTTNEVVLTLATGSYDAAHFDYVLKDGTNYRAGTVMAVWKGASVEFTDTSTNDIGNTLGADFSVDTNANNVRLKFTVSSGTWTIKTATRLI